MGSNCCSTASIVTRCLQLLVSGVQLLVDTTRLVYGWRQTRQDKTRQDKTSQQQQNLVKLEASLAPAEAEVGAMAKADQKF